MNAAQKEYACLYNAALHGAPIDEAAAMRCVQRTSEPPVVQLRLLQQYCELADERTRVIRYTELAARRRFDPASAVVDAELDLFALCNELVGEYGRGHAHIIIARPRLIDIDSDAPCCCETGAPLGVTAVQHVLECLGESNTLAMLRRVPRDDWRQMSPRVATALFCALAPRTIEPWMHALRVCPRCVIGQIDAQHTLVALFELARAQGQLDDTPALLIIACARNRQALALLATPRFFNAHDNPRATCDVFAWLRVYDGSYARLVEHYVRQVAPVVVRIHYYLTIELLARIVLGYIALVPDGAPLHCKLMRVLSVERTRAIERQRLATSGSTGKRKA